MKNEDNKNMEVNPTFFLFMLYCYVMSLTSL